MPEFNPQNSAHLWSQSYNLCVGKAETEASSERPSSRIRERSYLKIYAGEELRKITALYFWPPYMHNYVHTNMHSHTHTCMYMHAHRKIDQKYNLFSRAYFKDLIKRFYYFHNYLPYKCFCLISLDYFILIV